MICSSVSGTVLEELLVTREVVVAVVEEVMEGMVEVEVFVLAAFLVVVAVTTVVGLSMTV